ncbi:hypothetical protein VM636_21545 [Streptomyces sp. SCSIO 75703]|uniref:hypothetical protein n=1 Tax=unclassified Streptomyces TaxID=2593676 RepID=UPI0004C1DE8C|nr:MULTISPECIES: hypothetical protein [unclassified Streptomyces]
MTASSLTGRVRVPKKALAGAVVAAAACGTLLGATPAHGPAPAPAAVENAWHTGGDGNSAQAVAYQGDVLLRQATGTS